MGYSALRLIVLFFMIYVFFVCQAQPQPYVDKEEFKSEEELIIKRPVDIIKFKKELFVFIRQSNSNTEVKTNISQFINNWKKKYDIPIFFSIKEEKSDNKNWDISLDIIYDSFNFETLSIKNN